MSDASEYAALRSGALLIDRSDRVRFRFGGPRASELLTGLVTNDVLGLSPGHGQYAAALTPKGKIAADLRVFADEDGLLTDTSFRAAQGWRDIVKKYVNPRVAPYRDITAETRQLGVFGARSGKLVAMATGVSWEALSVLQPYSHLTAEIGGGSAMVVRVPELEIEGFEVIAPAAVESQLRSRLLSGVALAGGPNAYQVARVEAGWPEWGIDMNETTLAQEANLDALGAISYTKGCYTGQETVARVHFRGHVNKFLRRLHFVSASVPPMSAELTDDSGNVVGDVRSVALSPRIGGVAIAMVRRDVAAGTTLNAKWEGGECTVQIAAHEKGAAG
jgi:folate-binding protein YgfZ